MQAELDKKNILLKSISDRINPDVQNISPPRIEGHSEGKSAHKKRKRDKSNAQHEKAEDSAARKGSHKCGPIAYSASLSSMPVLWVLGTWLSLDNLYVALPGWCMSPGDQAAAMRAGSPTLPSLRRHLITARAALQCQQTAETRARLGAWRVWQLQCILSNLRMGMSYSPRLVAAHLSEGEGAS
jgi:hypothetical protein